MFQSARRFDGVAEQYDGTSVLYSIEIGEDSPASEPAIPDGFAGDACPIDTARDQLFPYRFQVKNLSFDFPSKLVVPMLSFGDPDGGQVKVAVSAAPSDGTKCEDTKAGGGSGMLLSFEDLQPKETSTVQGVIVAKDYYTPETPAGNRNALNAVVGSIGKVSCLDGPGAEGGLFTLRGESVPSESVPQYLSEEVTSC